MVSDDGHSIGPWTPGVGLASMRERAEQVGGTLTAAPHGRGGCVEVWVPLNPAGDPESTVA
ncbi:hypothetical protein C6I20_01280 [Aeromicrobium sp. A1-2]|nr:hypothetical protein C6I20_01280 [Aeromicrobium sp. A1-2]